MNCKRNYKQCDKCNYSYSLSVFNKHYRVCNGTPSYYKLIKHGVFERNDSIVCKFCNKVCKNANSQRSHSLLCKLNPNRRTTPFQDLEFQKSKNGLGGQNAFTKAKRLGLPRPITSDETRRKISERNQLRTKEWHKENGKKISQTVQRKVENNEWHTSVAKRMHKEYNGVTLHGKWELNYALWLDKNQIKWLRNTERFIYFFEDKKRFYTPDFYLPETQTYIEIKGYQTNKDLAKWNQFPNDKKLVVLKEADLKNLNII